MLLQGYPLRSFRLRHADSLQAEVPVKGVEGGDLLIRLETDGLRGGVLNYDKESGRLNGWVWIRSESAHALMGLLAAGQSIVFGLIGKRFRFRKASIESVYWFTKGHPDLDDPLAYLPVESSEFAGKGP
jgi:hypothetical protein